MQDWSELPTATEDGRARSGALDRVVGAEVTPTSVVTYLSRGRVLVVGGEQAALSAARRLDESLRCTLLCPEDGEPGTDRVEGMALIRRGSPRLSGSLGNFALSFESAEPAAQEQGPEAQPLQMFDLVLDLSTEPLIDYPIPPPGYYPVGGDEAALGRALEALPEMTGEFEKPKFFNYDPNICAHGSSGIEGCRRCIDACPTVAIASVGDKVQVNPYLCQGGGSCVVACPSGAMTYAYPTVADLLKHVRGLLREYSEAGGRDPALLFYDPHSRGALAGGLLAQLPEHVLPVEVEEVGSVGIDAWLACLAYGADSVLLCVTDGAPRQVVAEFETQLKTMQALLEGMGFEGGHVRLFNVSRESADAVGEMPRGVFTHAATFAAPAEKRMIIRLAVDHLYEHAPAARKTVPLPAEAPFGEVKVDKKACTLCMGCVSVCPVAALAAGGDLPQLKFVEWNCVQCGICETACPENAITRNPRFNFDSAARQGTRVLHEEQPFCCISCGKPFATQSVLDVMMKKLEGHWMFEDEAARRRLQMCDDCRVRDMFRSESAGPPTRQ
jgi:ferredoxin